MIKRIVKMSFQSEHVPQFLALFDRVRERILAQPGCHHVELWQDIRAPNELMTYSVWESEQDLNTYRNTPLFEEVWRTTKSYFADRAQAWSVHMINQA